MQAAKVDDYRFFIPQRIIPPGIEKAHGWIVMMKAIRVRIVALTRRQGPAGFSLPRAFRPEEESAF